MKMKRQTTQSEVPPVRRRAVVSDRKSTIQPSLIFEDRIRKPRDEEKSIDLDSESPLFRHTPINIDVAIDRLPTQIRRRIPIVIPPDPEEEKRKLKSPIRPFLPSDRSPLPSVRPFLPSVRSPDRSPLPSIRSPDRSPLPSIRSPDRSPLPSIRSPDRSPLPSVRPPLPSIRPPLPSVRPPLPSVRPPLPSVRPVNKSLNQPDTTQYSVNQMSRLMSARGYDEEEKIRRMKLSVETARLKAEQEKTEAEALREQVRVEMMANEELRKQLDEQRNAEQEQRKQYIQAVKLHQKIAQTEAEYKITFPAEYPERLWCYEAMEETRVKSYQIKNFRRGLYFTLVVTEIAIGDVLGIDCSGFVDDQIRQVDEYDDAFSEIIEEMMSSGFRLTPWQKIALIFGINLLGTIFVNYSKKTKASALQHIIPTAQQLGKTFVGVKEKASNPMMDDLYVAGPNLAYQGYRAFNPINDYHFKKNDFIPRKQNEEEEFAYEG